MKPRSVSFAPSDEVNLLETESFMVSPVSESGTLWNERSGIPNCICSGNAVVVKKMRKQENIWAVRACYSEVVSVLLVVHLAQFEKQSTKGM